MSFATLLSRLDPPLKNLSPKSVRSSEKKEQTYATKMLEDAAVTKVRLQLAVRELLDIFTLANATVVCGWVLCVLGGAGAAYNVITLRSFVGCAAYFIAGTYAVLHGSPRARNALRTRLLACLSPWARAALFEK